MSNSAKKTVTYADPYWKTPEERGVKAVEAKHQCLFSTCERYRYYLRCRWDELYEERAVVWIGLNPSTADEQKLDPTLTRIQGFTRRWGYTAFYMLNLFALRTPYPAVMKAADIDPVGPYNDEVIRRIIKEAKLVIAAWGTDGSWKGRDAQMVAILKEMNHEPMCVGQNSDGSPRHPLYVAADTKPKPYEIQ